MYALWYERITVKKSIGTSPFQLVYGLELFFPNTLILLVVILLQEEDAETHPTQRRMYKLVELQQQREHISTELNNFRTR